MLPWQGAGPGPDQHLRLPGCWPGVILLLAVWVAPVQAQTLSPDMLTPTRDGFAARNNALRKTGDAAANSPDDGTGNARQPKADQPAPSRIGRVPTYGLPSASGASAAGYDSLNRKKKKPKPYPGARKVDPKAPAQQVVRMPLVPTPVVPPPSAGAHRAPVSAAAAGNAAGQPQRRRLKAEADPYSAVGFYAGSFLTYAAIELSGGYDSNPGRISGGKGAPLYVVAPELLVASDWERHSLIADLRGSFTGYGQSGAATANAGVPADLDRPNFSGKINGRLDVSRDTRIDAETRLRVATDNPGSPNLLAGLSRYPIYTSVGGTLGGAQRFNRFEISANGTVDRTTYQESHLTDGSIFSNDDRNFNQYGGTLRGAYELTPAMTPFAEVQSDTRIHDLNADRNGYQRDSNGVSGRVGSSFELGRLITGQASIGYATRTYQDIRLNELKGLLAAASLIWTATPLTTVTLGTTSSVDESTLPGVSGVLSRYYTAQFDHAFRRWLIGTLRFGYGTAAYQGSDRTDQRSYAAANIVYKMTRTVQIKGEVRHDWLVSNVSGVNTQSTSFLIGMRFQP